MNLTQQTWIRLPPARRGAKCPVCGWSRRKIQTLIYGIPSQGIPPKVRHKHVPGNRGDKGIILVHVPSLMAHMLGETESSEDDLRVFRVMAKSPDWCTRSFNRLLDLSLDRAGLTVADFLTFLKSTDSELRTDSPQPPPPRPGPPLPPESGHGHWQNRPVIQTQARTW